LGNEIRCQAQVVLKEYPSWYNPKNIKEMNGWLGCYIYDEHWSVIGDKNICSFSLEFNNDSEILKARLPDSVAMITINGGYGKNVDVDVFVKIVDAIRPYINTADTKEIIGNVIGWCEDEDGHNENNFAIYLNKTMHEEYPAQVPVYCRECKNRSISKEEPCAKNDNCERIYYLGITP
jgi:hypothetical protein